MIEIKFRGRMVDTKEWVYGYLAKKYKCIAGRTVYVHIIQQELIFNEVKQLKEYEVIPETISQYTGVYDESENDKEIYKNDKVKFTYKDKEYVGIVKFEAGAFIIACNELADSYISLIDLVNSGNDYWWINGKVLDDTEAI